MHTIHVPDDTFARLAAAAHTTGTSVDEFALRTLERAAPTTAPAVPTDDEWQRRFDAHMRIVQARADRYLPAFRLDDSRESIYARCGE